MKKETRLNGWVAKVKYENIVQEIDGVDIKIIHTLKVHVLFPQPLNSVEIIGNFSRLCLPTGKLLQCTFIKQGTLLEGEFYYNPLFETIELSGVLSFTDSPKPKKFKPHFMITTCGIQDRHIEPKDFTSPEAKSEHITIEILLRSNGNTSDISNEQIVSRIMKKLNKIK